MHTMGRTANKLDYVNQANMPWKGMAPVEDTALFVTDLGGPGIPVVYLNGSYADQSHWKKESCQINSMQFSRAFDASSDLKPPPCSRQIPSVRAGRASRGGSADAAGC